MPMFMREDIAVLVVVLSVDTFFFLDASLVVVEVKCSGTVWLMKDGSTG